jgi:hypothetical protein
LVRVPPPLEQATAAKTTRVLESSARDGWDDIGPSQA